ncbi:MAG: MarR family transcriptional regulator [Gammaproteobacteria bacterium]|nr:MarR family transcriptional regulator [Gammaproteobacteria bacterium]
MDKTNFTNQKNTSLSHQLIKVGRLINERGLDSVRDVFNLPELKQSHLDLFPHIDFEGTSISEISKRKGVSKQSVSKLVKEMTHIKILSIKTDPEDSRSKIVFFKTSGFYSIQKGLEELVAIDRLISDHLGNKAYNSTLENISGLIDFFQTDNRK